MALVNFSLVNFRSVFQIIVAIKDRPKVTIILSLFFHTLGMAVYNVVIVCIVGTPVVSFVQARQFEASFIVTAICILFSTTSTLCIVFVPKVIK